MKYSFIFGRVRRCSFDERRRVLCPSSAFPKRRVALVAPDSGQIRERRLDIRPASHRRGQSHKGLLHDILGSHSIGQQQNGIPVQARTVCLVELAQEVVGQKPLGWRQRVN
jgi:hypothetical protein